MLVLIVTRSRWQFPGPSRLLNFIKKTRGSRLNEAQGDSILRGPWNLCIHRSRRPALKNMLGSPSDEEHNAAKFDDMPRLGQLKKFIPPVHLAKVLRVYDGDSITVGAPLHIAGERRFYKFSVRVRGIDCPEMRSRNRGEKQVAREAKKFVSERLMKRVVHLTRLGTDKYGRLLATVGYDGQDLSTQLLEAHLAVPYRGRRKNVIDWIPFRNQVTQSAFIDHKTSVCSKKASSNSYEHGYRIVSALSHLTF